MKRVEFVGILIVEALISSYYSILLVSYADEHGLFCQAADRSLGQGFNPKENPKCMLTVLTTFKAHPSSSGNLGFVCPSCSTVGYPVASDVQTQQCHFSWIAEFFMGFYILISKVSRTGRVRSRLPQVSVSVCVHACVPPHLLFGLEDQELGEDKLKDVGF